MSNVNLFRFVKLLWWGLFLWQFAWVQGKRRISEQKCLNYIYQKAELSMGGTISLYPDVVLYEAVEAFYQEFPHQAVLVKSKESATTIEMEFYCGGSLVSELFILTAAHCGRPTFVRLGERNISEPSDDEEDIEILDFIRHPNYTLATSYHDIALVQLSRPVEFSNWIQPACLWTSDSLRNSTVLATGFGATDLGGFQHRSSVLMKVWLTVLNQSKCEEKYSGYRKFPEGIKGGQLCLGSQKGDTCSGDSGSPIQVITDIDEFFYYVVGITSNGAVCGTGESKAVYTKVASYLDWIEQIVWPVEYLENQLNENSDE